MKYLKGYKLFESDKLEIIKDVEEAFYNISDKYFVKVESNKNRIIISILDEKINYNDIKDDLEFAVSYLINELKLDYYAANIFPVNPSKKEVTKYFRTFKGLIDYNNNDPIKRIYLYFNTKNVHNLV